VQPDVIRVVLADDHAVVRAGLRAVLGKVSDIDIVGEARGGREAIDLVERVQPNVVVMDLDMNDVDGMTATQEIVAKGGLTRILILTMHSEEESLAALLQAGASGFLVKTAADRELVDAIRAVACGNGYFTPAAARLMAQRLVKKESRHQDSERFAELSDREQAVLRLIAHGYSGPEIGTQLSISPKTVETYKQRIQDKLGLSHRAEYIRFAIKLGLLNE
jgi:two-component system, NarL family, response regulator NreC